MQKPVVFFFLLLLFSSCFLVKDYKKSHFAYTQNGQATTLPLVVPRGFVKQERSDTAGITLQTFHYPGGAVLYAAYLPDTTYEIQRFSDSLHQPQVHRLGGQVYKEQGEKELFRREIRQGHLRFGYRQVPGEFEWLFDSATNHASLQVPKR